MKEKNFSFLLFVLSLLATMTVAFIMFIFFMKPNKTAVGVSTAETPKSTTVLFADIDNNVNYSIFIDYGTASIEVTRLYFNNDIYNLSGFSGTLKAAQKINPQIKYGVIVTETRLASLIDYLGGYPAFVTEHISTLCGGISQGKQNIVGISLIKAYQNEVNNKEFCMGVTKWLANGWCEKLSDKRAFFKLLDLCENNISYADYLPVMESFKKFVEK